MTKGQVVQVRLLPMRLLIPSLMLFAHGVSAQAGPDWALGFAGQADDRVVAVVDGQLVWSRTGLVVEWDGYNGTTAEPLVEGVYFFALVITLPNGNLETQTGYIHLIR